MRLIRAAHVCFVCLARTLTTSGMQVHSGGVGESMLARTSRIAIERRRESLVSKGRCEACWLHSSMCLCGAVRRLWAGQQSLKTHVAVYFHYKEWGRSSNTGRLLSIGLGAENVSTFIYGNPRDEAALNDLLSNNPSCILFPSAASVPIDQLFPKSGPPPHTTPSTGEEEGGGGKLVARRVLCVLDSTWNQASALDKSLSPSIPRGNINSLVDGPSNFLSRKQSLTATKISTIEAAALALQLLGEERDALDRIDLSLKMSVDVLKVQGGREPAFVGQVGEIRPSFAPTTSPALDSQAQAQAQPQAQPQGPFTAPSIAKPEQCPLCKTAPRRGFKNLGLRRPFDEEKQQAGSYAYRVWRCTGCSECFNVDAALPAVPGPGSKEGEVLDSVFTNVHTQAISTQRSNASDHDSLSSLTDEFSLQRKVDEAEERALALAEERVAAAERALAEERAAAAEMIAQLQDKIAQLQQRERENYGITTQLPAKEPELGGPGSGASSGSRSDGAR